MMGLRNGNSEDIKEKSELASKSKSIVFFKANGESSKKRPEDNGVSDVLLAQTSEEYRSYPERWWLLVTVVILNLANYSHWVAFPSVTKSAAKYYDQDGDAMDLIPTLSYGFGIPCCLLATYVVENLGLKIGLFVGGSLTGIGGLLCFFSSLPYDPDQLTNDGKFYLAIVGQALTGIACPFVSCVPTKISQHWFGDEERTVATILLGMSSPIGIVLGQGLTPLMVTKPEQVPIMNIVWFVLAFIGSVLTFWKVKANRPPTPPSHSAEAQTKNIIGYWSSFKSLSRNIPFIIIFLFLGAAMGYISTLSTKIEQMLCSRGYSDQLSGLSGSLILLCGFLASFLFGLLARKIRHIVCICKVSGLVVIVFLIMIAWTFRQPHMNWAVVLSCSLLGVFSLGVYPLALELVVECTYPLDQATPTALIFLSSSLQGVFLMEVENRIGSPLSPDEMEIQTCVSSKDSGHQRPKDYSSYLNFVTLYMIIFIAIFVLAFRTKLKRQEVDDSTPATTPTILKNSAQMTELLKV